MKSANGALVLVLGILSWVGFGCFTGIPAWIVGNNSLRDIDAGLADPTERGMVQAGRILGMVNCLLLVAAILFWILAVGAIGVAGGMSTGGGSTTLVR